MTFDLLDLVLAFFAGLMTFPTYFYASWREWKDASTCGAVVLFGILFIVTRHLT